jgi:hypothetical protein
MSSLDAQYYTQRVDFWHQQWVSARQSNDDVVLADASKEYDKAKKELEEFKAAEKKKDAFLVPKKGLSFPSSVLFFLPRSFFLSSIPHFFFLFCVVDGVLMACSVAPFLFVVKKRPAPDEAKQEDQPLSKKLRVPHPLGLFLLSSSPSLTA